MLKQDETTIVVPCMFEGLPHRHRQLVIAIYYSKSCDGSLIVNSAPFGIIWAVCNKIRLSLKGSVALN